MLLCIGGVCIPYTAIVPLFLLAIKWVFAKLHSYGLIPNFVTEIMNLKQMQQTPSSCDVADETSSKEEQSAQRDCDEDDANHSPTTTESAVVKELQSEKQFEELTKKNKKVVVKFTATWCKPCHKIQPYFQKKCKEYSEYDFITIDVDDFDDLSSKFNVAMMPTFIIVKGTKLLATYRGSSEPELETFLKENL